MLAEWSYKKVAKNFFDRAKKYSLGTGQDQVQKLTAAVVSNGISKNVYLICLQFIKN